MITIVKAGLKEKKRHLLSPGTTLECGGACVRWCRHECRRPNSFAESCQCSLKCVSAWVSQTWGVAAWRGQKRETAALEGPQWVSSCHTAQHRASQALKITERHLSLLLSFNFPSSFTPHLAFLDPWAQTHPQVIKILSLVHCKYTAFRSVSAAQHVHYGLDWDLESGSAFLMY